jgi:hypothetical protein
MARSSWSLNKLPSISVLRKRLQSPSSRKYSLWPRRVSALRTSSTSSTTRYSLVAGWSLSNRAVLGEFKPKGREVIQDYYPQIISQSEFDAARAKIKTKTRHGNYAGGNRKNSLLAKNLFEGLLLDITTEPIRTMQFQDSRNIHNVMSAFDRGGRHSNRIRYDKLEKALLGFLETVEWLAIAGESESDEFKGAMVALEAKRRYSD